MIPAELLTAVLYHDTVIYFLLHVHDSLARYDH